MERRTSLAVLRKPIRLYHALATLILGIILASLTNVTYDKYATRSKVMKENHETLHRSSDSDSITFYTAPSHRIGGT